MIFGTIPGLDKPVSRICQGTVMLTPKKKSWSFEILDAVFEAGINTFDSAHIYGGGDCDRVFGEWVHRRSLRSEVVLLDKGSHSHGDLDRVTPRDLTADLEDCLERLGFETIDLYALHRDDPTQPVGPIIDELNAHVASGKIAAFGASNWSHDRIREANNYAGDHGLQGFALSSPNYGLAEQIDDPWGNSTTITGSGEALAYYAESRVPLFPWSSLAGGLFSGRFTRDNLDSFENDSDQRCVRCYCSPANFDRLDRAQIVANERGVSVAQVALAWILTDPLDCFPLTAAWAPEEATQNAASVEIELSNAERAWLSLDSDER